MIKNKSNIGVPFYFLFKGFNDYVVIEDKNFYAYLFSAKATTAVNESFKMYFSNEKHYALFVH